MQHELKADDREIYSHLSNLSTTPTSSNVIRRGRFLHDSTSSISGSGIDTKNVNDKNNRSHNSRQLIDAFQTSNYNKESFSQIQPSLIDLTNSTSLIKNPARFNSTTFNATPHTSIGSPYTIDTNLDVYQPTMSTTSMSDKSLILDRIESSNNSDYSTTISPWTRMPRVEHSLTSQSTNPLLSVTFGGPSTVENSMMKQDKGLKFQPSNNLRSEYFGTEVNLGRHGGISFMGRNGGGRGLSRPPMSPLNSSALTPVMTVATMGITSCSGLKQKLLPHQSTGIGRIGDRRPYRSTTRDFLLSNADPDPETLKGHDNDFGNAGTQVSSMHSAPSEIALTTGLLSLSIHEALTFDGVELALHPDVFLSVQSSTKSDTLKEDVSQSPGTFGTSKQQVLHQSHRHVCSGDLVEIRVWSPRPDTTKSTNSNFSQTLSSNSTGSSSYHSRNPSLVTLSSTSISALSPGGVNPAPSVPPGSVSTCCNSSLLSTTQYTTAAANMSLPPLIPSVIGGDIQTSSDYNPASSSRAVHLQVLGECSKASGATDSLSDVLQGVDILETPLIQDTSIDIAGTIGTTASNMSVASTFKAASSMLFRNLKQPTLSSNISESATPTLPSVTNDHKASFSNIVSESRQGHSRDSSLITNSSVLNNRENSYLSPSSSMLTGGGGISGSSLTEDNLHKSSLTKEEFNALHSLTASLSIPPMRRDGPLMMTSAAPSFTQPLAVTSSSLESLSPSCYPSSPKNVFSTPLSVTPPSSASLHHAGDIHTISSSQSIPTTKAHEVSASASNNVGIISNADNHSISFDFSSHDTDNRSCTELMPDPSSSPYRLPSSTTEALSYDSAPHKRHHSAAGAEFSCVAVRREESKIGHNRHSTSSVRLLQPSLLHQLTTPATLAILPILPESVEENARNHKQESDTGAGLSAMATKSVNVMDAIQETHFVRSSFIMPISERSLTSIKSGARTQVSLLRRVADLYKITAYDTVTITQVGKSNEPYIRKSIAADFITVTMKDQFVSRGDMYSFQKSLLNTWVYEGKRLSFDGIRTNAKVIRHGDHAIRSGIISENTKMTFRSRSARIIWLVQLSSEMWDFASPYEKNGSPMSHESSCHLYFDKFVTFARRLFAKWKKIELSHNLTVIYFSRTYIRHQEQDKDVFSPSTYQSGSTHVDTDGRLFEDHYKVVVENETRADWSSLIHIMKKEFINYPTEARWDLTLGNERIPSTASQGNVLEAINITLNLLYLHYIDRDLHRTGNSIVIITSGNGVFEIDKNLAGITKQRMMDNGIGSDMLSLSLPPLHVAPFFVYKEKGSSSAEEIQGFDDWKVYFEIPHWMNLSFVCYDNDEEPMLYKQSIVDNADSTNETKDGRDFVSRGWQASNGFLMKSSCVEEYACPSPDAGDKMQYKQLISDRKFDDILQACRPRNRGEYGSGLPLSLSYLIQNFKTSATSKYCSNASPPRKFPQGLPLIRSGMNQSIQSLCMEWGSVNFDRYIFKRGNDTTAGIRFSHYSESQSSPSSFASAVSCNFNLQLCNLSHLQFSTSLKDAIMSDNDGCKYLSTMKIDDSDDGNCSAMDGASARSDIISRLKKIMSDHDQNTFTHSHKSKLIVADPVVFHHSAYRQSVMSGSHSTALPAHNQGGIEAALASYDDHNQQEQNPLSYSTGTRGGDTFENSVVFVDEAYLRPIALSPISGLLPYSLDRRNESLRPSVMRLVAPEALSRSSYRLDFQPLEDRRKSFSVLNDCTHSVCDAKQSDHLKRQTFRNTKGSALQRTTIKKQLNRNVKISSHHHHHTHRHRQRSWVLNPFRQEDEDEVLAKRTHNRRRWSHVFPLGEQEFKRHAGPNWKSLCQPAILPITIDFHPSTQELQDQDKFRVKQYSITLPPMNETNYKSHTELLDELVVQRIIQDFQIVPMVITEQQCHRGEVTENILENTLSMGHKIQKLSYNPTQDSVDVIEYSAKFAENENPQTYHYSIWSNLRNDYVSVAQTFTKYTSPYKWNELDMLISGDTITHIVEGMRYPRISFVIIPDKFSTEQEEKEYCNKFQRLIDYFIKLQPKVQPNKIEIVIHSSNDSDPKGSSEDRRFIVDLRKRNDDKNEWMEMVHDSNCDTRRTFRITIQWLVAVAVKIDQQAQLLQRRCSQYGLKLVSVPHYSALRSCFLNPFVVPITIPINSKSCVDMVERALSNMFDFVYDGSHISDPNELDNLKGFDFLVNDWSIKKRKKFIPARQYLHRSGALFTRIIRDTRGCAIFIMYLNIQHIHGDYELRNMARKVFNDVESYIQISFRSIEK